MTSLEVKRIFSTNKQLNEWTAVQQLVSTARSSDLGWLRQSGQDLEGDGVDGDLLTGLGSTTV